MTAITTLAPKRRTLWGDAVRRMRKSPLTMLGLGIVSIMIFMAVFAPLIAPYSPTAGDINKYYVKPPSTEHPFGTDDVGRDILSRIIYGAQISLKVAVLAEAIGLTIGIVLGLVTGYYGGWLDAIVMRIVDIFMAFPLLIIAIALVAALGPSETNIFIALALVI